MGHVDLKLGFSAFRTSTWIGREENAMEKLKECCNLLAEKFNQCCNSLGAKQDACIGHLVKLGVFLLPKK